jgi:hypothetical protein
MDEASKLILCGDHSYAPWCIVCRHLVIGGREWVRVPGNDGSQDDWLCPECAAQLPTPDDRDLMAVCIHCARELQAKRT